jgi:hypothetical protein
MHLQKLFKKKEFTTQGAPCVHSVQAKIFVLEYNLLGAFCH